MMRRELIILLAEIFILHPQITSRLAELDGRVQSINVQRKEVVVKDTQEKSYAIHMAPETRILNDENRDLRLEALSVDDPVRVWYSTVDFSAQEVDLLPGWSSVLLSQF